MKKYISLTLILLLILTLIGCGTKKADSKPDIYDIVKETNTQTLNETIAETSAQTQSNTKISKDEAINLALNHAQLKKDDVTLLFTELDFDDGIYKYKVDFRYDKYEYDYEINAKTGEIISFEKDLFD